MSEAGLLQLSNRMTLVAIVLALILLQPMPSLASPSQPAFHGQGFVPGHSDSRHPVYLSQSRRDSRQASGGMSLGEAVAIAKQRHQGEVISARRSKDGSGRTVYMIKILRRDGVVKKVRINAG